MTPIVITEQALQLLIARNISSDWFIKPDQQQIFPCILISSKEAEFVLHEGCREDSRLLVIERRSKELFSGVPPLDRRQVFDRCARIALRGFGAPVNLNPRWMPYHHNNLVSIFAYPDLGRRERIVAQIHPAQRQDVVVFALSNAPEVQQLEALSPDISAYKAVVSGLRAAIVAAKKPSSGDTTGSIDLDDVTPGDFANNLTYSEWYPRYLSKRQREFVDHSLTGPIRLRGAAGTGKTLAMIIKALKVAYEAKSEGKRCRILFATHSWAAAELVDRVMERVDERHILRSRDDNIKIDIFPLLTLAERRDYSKIGRTPLGIDSADGKRRTLDEISEVVDDFIIGDWAAFRSGCSREFVNEMEAPVGSRIRRILCWDLLIEFGCVLAAQGILGHAAHEQRYLRIKRLRWMMPLANETEKKVVFGLWVGFLDRLRQQSLIASDQIISDYLNELSTFYWEAARSTQGYDVIFVDEMHLFNAQERLIFHNLLADPEIPPLVIMAMDPKQSPRETFTSVHSDSDDSPGNIYERARLPNPESIDLIDVYRYTPEIDRVIKSINEAAPALDLPADWDIPPGHSRVSDGEVPKFTLVANKLQAYKTGISVAQKIKKDAQAHKGRVAILCLDEDRFLEYSTAAHAQYPTEALVIASRDDTEQLRYAGKKFVVSTPEYVAGLQFDTVILLDANKDQIPDGQYSGHHLRRFLSELYLGISRAERRLFFIATRDAGGLTDILGRAAESNVIHYAEDLVVAV